MRTYTFDCVGLFCVWLGMSVGFAIVAVMGWGGADGVVSDSVTAALALFCVWLTSRPVS